MSIWGAFAGLMIYFYIHGWIAQWATGHDNHSHGSVVERGNQSGTVIPSFNEKYPLESALNGCISNSLLEIPHEIFLRFSFVDRLGMCRET